MSQAIKVGIFSTLALVVAAYLILRIEDLNPFAESQTRIDAVFDSVAGLDDKASVRVAGVRIGRVDGIALDGRKARVTLVLEQPVALTEGSRARIANMGLLGDKYVELVPGPSGAPPLAEGTVLVGKTPVSFDDAMAKFEDIGTSIQQVTGSLSGKGDQDTPLARLISNLEATTAEIRILVATNREQVSGTVRNFESFSATLARELPVLSDRLETLIAQVGDVVGENRDELHGSLANIEEVSAGLKVSVANLNAITTKLNSGEGTLGKLISSDEAHTELVSTLDSIKGGVATLSDTLGRVQKLKLDLGIEGYYLSDRQDSHSAFTLDLDPGSGTNRLYRLGLVNTPSGKERTKTQVVTVTNPDGTTETTTIDTFTREDTAVLSALLGVRLDSGARLWGGLIENKAGVQVDYPFLQRRLWLGLEAFDFDRENDRDPHLRLGARYHLGPNLYLTGGYDDPLESDFDSLFIGGGLTWTDDDLKYLLGSVPAGAL
jgi:phospholipid/cholesterol/gamma-HCH transport system substrate-binding protein